MGDFTDLLNAVPEFTNGAQRESFVDAHGHEILRITPLDGSPAVYASSVQVQSTQGPMTVQFPLLGVDSIQSACAAWQGAAREAIKALGEKMRENQRRIVLPGNTAANSAPFKSIN